MIRFTDLWVIPWLAILAEWSVRWGVLLLVMAAWFALRPPRRAATRYLLCAAALVGGLLIPLAPRWGNLSAPWPKLAAKKADSVEPLTASPEAHASSAVPDSGRDAFDVPNLRARTIVPVAVTRSTSIALGPWRLVSLAVASAWVSGVLFCLIRLAGVWLVLVRLSRGAMNLDWKSNRLLFECRSALGLTRNVKLGSHPAIVSPVAIGCRALCILVPPDWGDWPETYRRACLLHEMAHLARRDDWAKLAQELIAAVFFFHPPVRWLLARLDRERELLCDEAVVALGTEPAGYARLLLDLARRPGRIRSVSARLRPMLLPFLDRRTVAIRITRLLEDDMLRTLSQASFRRSLILGSLAVAVALGVTGLRVRAGAPQSNQESKAQPTTRSNPSSASSRKIEGVILDPDGKPVDGAIVVAGIPRTGKANQQVFHTDSSGRFTWSIPEGQEWLYFVTFKEGLSPAIWDRPMAADQPGERRKVKLGQSRPFSALLVDSGGKPIDGAKVRVEALAHFTQKQDGPQTMTTIWYDRIRREILDGSPLERLFETMTDADGSFGFAALERDSALMLGAAASDGRKLRIRVKNAASESVRRGLEEEGFVTALAGEKAALVAVPEARVAGRVVTKLPGVGVAGLTVSFQTTNAYRAMTNFAANDVLTDADGRFGFEGLNEGSVNIFVHGDGETKDWTYRAAKDVILNAGVTSQVTIELIRGVIVEGTVVAKETNEPLVGFTVSVKGPFRPRTGAATMFEKTDARGRYRLRLPSGETEFCVNGPVPGKASRISVSIPEERSRLEVPEIAVVTDPTIRAQVLDANGVPIAGVTVVGVDKDGVLQPFLGSEFVTDARGQFVLPSAVYDSVATGKFTPLRVRLRSGAEHVARITFTTDYSVVVRLPVGGDDVKSVE